METFYMKTCKITIRPSLARMRLVRQGAFRDGWKPQRPVSPITETNGFK